MSELPTDRYYTETHEWCLVKDGIATLGITQHAAELLTDLVIVEYSKAAGDDIVVDEEFGEIESVKAAEPLISPVTGKVTEINSFEEEEKLSLINDAPYNEGWMIKIQLTKPSELETLLSADQYREYLEKDH